MAFRRARKKGIPLLANMMADMVGAKTRMPKELIQKKAHKTCSASFEENPSLSFVVAEKTTSKGGVMPVGYASFYYTFSTWTGRALHVKDIFVTEDYRGEGVGSSLGKEIVQIALAEKCARINWLIDCTEKMEMNFSNKFKPSFVDFLNYKMSAESVKTFSEGGLLKKRDLGEITIKLGTQEHIKEVLDLVIELAVYEKEPEAVVIGEKEMIECAFGPCKCYNFLVAETPTESGPKVVGFTVFFPVYEALEQGIHMEDLYVTPKYRGAGLGTEMMRMLAKFISTNNWDFLRYQVLDWNKGAIALYHKLEGKCLENIKNYRLEKKQML